MSSTKQSEPRWSVPTLPAEPSRSAGGRARTQKQAPVAAANSSSAHDTWLHWHSYGRPVPARHPVPSLVRAAPQPQDLKWRSCRHLARRRDRDCLSTPDRYCRARTDQRSLRPQPRPRRQHQSAYAPSLHPFPLPHRPQGWGLCGAQHSDSCVQRNAARARRRCARAHTRCCYWRSGTDWATGCYAPSHPRCRCQATPPGMRQGSS